jgi:hypothetical protein
MPPSAAPSRSSSDWACDPAIETAAGYLAAVRHAPDRTSALRAAASRTGPAALLEVLRSVPRETATFSATPAGEELRGWFGAGRRLPVDRVPVGLLRLPASRAEYLRGRPRQALRTNLNRAAADGVTSTTELSLAEVERSAEHIGQRRGGPLALLTGPRALPGVAPLFAVSHDAAGDPVAVCEVVVDGSWAGLRTLQTVPDGQTLRYPLHTHVVTELIAREVTMLTVRGSMLLTSAGTRYFQRRTGYEPVWLRPDPVPTPAAPVAVDAPSRTRPSIPRQRTGSGSPDTARELTSRS